MHQICSSSRWDYHFPFFVLSIYVHLYWSWELVVFTLLYVGGTYAKLVYTWYKNIFRMIEVLILFYAANGAKMNLMKKNHNKTGTRQIWDSVTVGNPKASKINTLLSFPIHWARCWSAAASIVVFGPFDASSILCRRICWCCCSLCAHIPPPKPPSLS